MGNMLTAKVKVCGVKPLLWHAFGPDALPLEKREKTGVAGNDPQEWKRTVLANKDGQLYIEPSYVFGAMRDAAKYTKKGRGSIQTMVAATLQVVEDRVYTDRRLPHGIEQPPETDPEQPVYLDVRSVRNPATKARNVRYRVAASVGWSAEFTLLWDSTIVSRGEMQAVAIDAGRLCGLGDGRGIGFGRFVVESFELQEESVSA